MTSRLALPLVAALSVLTGCGGSAPTSAPAGDRAASAAPAASASASAGSPGEPGAESRPSGGSAATGAPTTTSRVTSPAGGTAQSAGTAEADAASSRSTAPGAYTYDNTGTVTAGTPQDASGTATLTVDPPAGSGQRSVLASREGRTEQDVVVRRGGTYLTRLVITNPAFTKEFRPPATGLLVPDPATPGRSWSWRATSTDGKTTASVAAKVSRTDTLTVGGQRTPTTVITSTLELTGDITYTARMETWYDAAHRLAAKEHTKGSGSYGGFAFSTDITSVLRSTRPR